MGRSRSHSGKKLLENLPKIALYQYCYFGLVWPIQFVFCLYTLLKVVSYYDLSVLSKSVMGFQTKKFLWVGGVSSIQCYFGFLVKQN